MLFKSIFNLCLLILLVSQSVIADGDFDYDVALDAYKSQNYLKAARYFKLAAKLGDPVSQRYLGELYDKGRGLRRNYEKAFFWYKEAAKQNDVIAQYRVGVKYDNGHGTKMNKHLAYTWFVVAFENGHKPASYALKILNQSLTTKQRQLAMKRASTIVSSETITDEMLSDTEPEKKKPANKKR